MNGRDVKTLGDSEARLPLTLASRGKQIFTTSDVQTVGRQELMFHPFGRIISHQDARQIRPGVAQEIYRRVANPSSAIYRRASPTWRALSHDSLA
jgi:hypothetical protein